jgi:Asp-tRNA(Asn)/Glu-tRNA(Gln) amidotransferase A subunit family amidase
VMEASGSLDTLGILARSIPDIALYRDVLLGTAPEPTTAAARPPRIGFCRTHAWDQIEASTCTLVEDAAFALARAGARVADVELPDEFARLNQAHRWISSFEFARTFTWEIENHWEAISETLRKGRLADGLSCSLELYVEMKELADDCRRRLDALWDDYDVLLAPSAFGEAPVGRDAFAGAALYQMWTVLHVPAISLPVLRGPNDMPIGIQLFAKRHNDRNLFGDASWVHRQLT